MIPAHIIYAPLFYSDFHCLDIRLRVVRAQHYLNLS